MLGEEHPEVAMTLNSLGVLYRELGEYEQAEALCRQALHIQRTILGEQHPEVATSFNNLAVLSRELGDTQQAEEYYQEALRIEQAIFGQQHPGVATTLNNLAHLHTDLGAYEQAEVLYLQVLALRKSVLGEQHPEVASTLNNLAMLYFATEKYEQAIDLCQQALELQRTTMGEQHPDMAATLGNLAVLSYTLGAYQEAEDACRQAVAMQRSLSGEQHPDVAGWLNNLAVLCAATGRATEALELMQQVRAIDHHLVDQIFSISSERQRLAFLGTLQGDLDALLSLAIRSFSGVQEVEQMIVNEILRRKALTMEVLVAQQEVILAGRYPALRAQFEALGTLRRQISAKELAGPGIEEYEEYQRLLHQWRKRRERLEADLARQIPEMRISSTLQQVTFQEVARELPVGSALIEFIRMPVFDFQAIPAQGKSPWQPAQYLACILLADEPDRVQLSQLGSADTIGELLTAFRMTMTGEAEQIRGSLIHDLPDTGAQQRESTARQLQLILSGASFSSGMQEGKALRRLIFDPLLPLLHGATRLFMAPDGDLSRLPFEVLPMDDGTYLIDTYQISYLSTPHRWS